MASNSREARRRKILERGSDRLAFITGQINNVPPPPSSDPTSLSQSHLPTDESSSDTVTPREQIRTDRETGPSFVLSLYVKFDFRYCSCVCVFAIASCFLEYWVMMCCQSHAIILRVVLKDCVKM